MSIKHARTNPTMLGISRDTVAGGAAGGAARLLTSPFDVLKIRFQLQSHESPKYRSMFHAVRTIVKEEGFLSLWKGNLSATYLYVSYAMVQFSMYSFLRTLLAPNVDSSSVSSSWNSLMLFSAGAGAGITAVITTYPFDIMRTQFALQGKVKYYNTISSFVRGTYRTQGMRGFYTGLGPGILGVAPYMGLNFAIYEWLNKYVDQLSNIQSVSITYKNTPATLISPPDIALWSVLQKCVVGGSSGGLSKIVMYPFDTLKRRLQAQGLQSTFAATSVHDLHSVTQPRYNSIIHCVKSIYATEGIRGFYKGLLPTTAKSVLTTAMTFTAYETTKDFFIRQKEYEDGQILLHSNSRVKSTV